MSDVLEIALIQHIRFIFKCSVNTENSSFYKLYHSTAQNAVQRHKAHERKEIVSTQKQKASHFKERFQRLRIAKPVCVNKIKAQTH